VSVSTLENAELVDEMICSQEEHPGEHYSIREIAEAMSVSTTSVHRMVKKKGYCAYKRVSTPQMTGACRERRVERSALLVERFSENSLCRLVFQDEKDFTLQVPANRQNNRFQI